MKSTPLILLSVFALATASLSLANTSSTGTSPTGSTDSSASMNSNMGSSGTSSGSSTAMKGSEKSSDKSADMKKGEAKVGDIASNPQKWMNKSVTVSGEVQKLSSDSKSFMLNDQAMPAEQILVINKSSAEMSGDKAIKDSDQVRVSGKVEKLSGADIERKYSVQLDSSTKDQMTSAMPVLVSDASSFKVIKSQ